MEKVTDILSNYSKENRNITFNFGHPGQIKIVYYKPGHVTGIFGRMGCGKTMLMTILGISAWKKHDRKLFSNYALKKVPYQPVNTLSDAYRMKNGIFLADEFWTWIWSRTSMSDINKEFMKLIMLCRKRDVSIIYTAQLSRTVDVLIREVTNSWLYPWLQPIYDNKGRFVTSMLKFRIIDPESKNGCELGLKKSLSYYGQFYDTKEEIADINSNENAIPTPLDKGIALEYDFATALLNSKLFDHVDLLKQSGKLSSWKYDVISYKNGKSFAFDVKSSTSKRVTLNYFGNELRSRIRNAYDHGALPFIAFPKVNRKRLTIPSSWYIHKLDYNDYLVRLSSQPFYNKLIKNSIQLNDMGNYTKYDINNVKMDI